MSRRRKDGDELADFIVMFSELPLWVVPLGAVLTYVVLEWLIPAAVGKSHTFGMTITALSTLTAPWLAGVVLLSGIFGALKRLAGRRIDSRILGRQVSIDSIRALSWQDFERMLAAAYRDRGYSVTLTPRGADGGVDLVMTRDRQTTYVQAKHWKARQVGVQRVRELHGVAVANGVSNSILVSSGNLSSDARAFAAKAGMTVVEGTGLMPLIQPFLHGELTGAAPTASCPTCGSDMVERLARTGANAGSRFLGCSRYPRCRGIRKFAQ